VLKKARKGQADCLKARKSQTLFAVLPFLCHKKTFKLQEYQKNVFEITIRLTLASRCVGGWSSLLLILLWLFMVCESAHFGYNSATVCILIHRQLSAPIWKSSPNNFYTSTRIIAALHFLTSLRHHNGTQPNLVANYFAGKSIARQRRIFSPGTL